MMVVVTAMLPITMFPTAMVHFPGFGAAMGHTIMIHTLMVHTLMVLCSGFLSCLGHASRVYGPRGHCSMGRSSVRH